MISKNKDDKLIRIYGSRDYDHYLYAIHHEGHVKVKRIHRFATEYLKSLFPIPSL